MRSRKDIQTQEGLVTLLCAERRKMLLAVVIGVGVAGGKGPQWWVTSDGGFRRQQSGRKHPPSPWSMRRDFLSEPRLESSP